MNSFYSNGKLLLTGEYLVLDGAISLAVPTKYGQTLQVKPISENKITWNSFDENENLWFSKEFDLKMRPLDSSFDRLRMAARGDKLDFDTTERLIEILGVAKKLNPDFLKTGFEVKTNLDFPRNWGLGTSSTLINNIANWAKVDAFELLEQTFGGSGYDIACAQNDSAITYQLKNNSREIKAISFEPMFSENLFFIHLNKKQDSRQGISKYNSKKSKIKESISEINSITEKMINCTNLSEFESLINKHEAIISNVLDVPTVKETLFKDYKKAIKSLGAWGGDFILVTGTINNLEYFKKKGYHTIIDYNKMVL